MKGAATLYHHIPMNRRKAEPGERIFIFRVIQSNRAGKVRGYPYRILAIPEVITLFEFAGEICHSFRFGFDHMFGFYNNPKNFYKSTEGFELFADDPETAFGKIRPEFEGVVRTPVNRAFQEAGKKMLFLFDYGDEWYFLVELTEIADAEPGLRYPRLLRSEGKALTQYRSINEET
jgi:hypothetical protein